MNYFVTIGIEIHCELKTNTKMFSGAPVRFGEIANTCTSVVDLGHPGCLPCVNKEAEGFAWWKSSYNNRKPKRCGCR